MKHLIEVRDMLKVHASAEVDSRTGGSHALIHGELAGRQCFRTGDEASWRIVRLPHHEETYSNEVVALAVIPHTSTKPNDLRAVVRSRTLWGG
eukprot:CAMPEP_0182849926 /NCGR_PEP_ID=MMETSP0006_2-20121128/29815_1 /TAXON_ID=97485 /ORGANISM="Prymnesium parvum, Strain Texoma1" /LENGTH=92 /DNA_ID=CAMNT_0024980485 /DNA_START=90 /DNA_END=369 /DNA_ORIENTATION=-